MVNGNLLNFGKRYQDDLRVKVALRFGWAKQSKNLKRCLLNMLHISQWSNFDPEGVASFL